MKVRSETVAGAILALIALGAAVGLIVQLLWHRHWAMNVVGTLFAGIAAILGAFLIFKPQDYGDQMAFLGDLFEEFPLRAIRILGAVLIAIAVCLFYLLVKGAK
jgi:hypothetical protein